MANQVSAFFETLLAATDEYNQAVVGQVALLDCVYKDVRTEAARAGQTVNIVYPDVGPFTDQQSSDLVTDDINPQMVQLIFQTHPVKGIVIRDFEQYRTATDIRSKFLDSMYKRGTEYLNGQIAALLTPGNFNYNAAIQAGGASTVKVADHLNAWNALANARVPMYDSDKLHLCVHNVVHQNMIQDPQWVQENVVSATIAREARETGHLTNAFMFQQVWDQQMPTVGASIINGAVKLTAASTAVVGSSTKFLTDLTTSDFLIFGNDVTRTPYAITSIADDTHLALTSSTGILTAPQTSARKAKLLTGTLSITNNTTALTGSGTAFTTELAVGQSIVFYDADSTFTPYQITAITSNTAAVLGTPLVAPTIAAKHAFVQGFTSVALHEYAIGLALRPIGPPESGAVTSTYVNVKGIPFRVILSYQHLKQGHVLSMDYGYALAVIRPSFGVVINS